MLVLSIVSFGKQNEVNNAFKYLISIRLKSSITKCLPKKALQVIIWDFWDIIQFLHILLLFTKCIYFTSLVSFFSR